MLGINNSDGEFRLLLALVERISRRVLTRDMLLDLLPRAVLAEHFDRAIDVQTEPPAQETSKARPGRRGPGSARSATKAICSSPK